MRTSFGNNLRTLRELNNLSQRELADTINTTQATIASYENGGRYPQRSSIINSLYNILNCNEIDLFGYSDGIYARRMLFGKSDNSESTGKITSHNNKRVPIKDLDNGKLKSNKKIRKPIDENILKKYPKGNIIKVNDESMNRYIPIKSYAYVANEKDLDAYENKICAISLDGYKILFRRLSFPHIDNLITLIPQSTKDTYESQTVDLNKYPNFKIFGKVVWFCKNAEKL